MRRTRCAFILWSDGRWPHCLTSEWCRELSVRAQVFVGQPFVTKKSQPTGLSPLPTRAAAGDAEADKPAEEKLYLGSTVETWKKIIPLGLMFFCILFNYTILRDTKVRFRPLTGDRASDRLTLRAPVTFSNAMRRMVEALSPHTDLRVFAAE